jgi:hypothetical protein
MVHWSCAVYAAYICAVVATASEDTNWHKYVRAPSSRIVAPRSILNTTGTVVNAQALVTNETTGVATLYRNHTTDPVPSITIDFGLNIVGYPQVFFSSASANNPGIRLTFSETVQYLTNVSDFTRSDNGDTITPGTDQFAVPAAGTAWTDTHGCLYNGNQVCADGLHGFRYMRIALDALESDAPFAQPNGTVSIAAISLNFTAFLGRPETYTGWFECSDEALTQYWFNSAYTNEMVTDHFRANDVDPRDSASPTLEGKLVLFDGAKRDRDPYVGDITVSGLTTYLTHNTSEAVRNVIADLADHQRSDGWIPPASIDNYTLPLFDYPLHWIVTSWQYVLYSGDLVYAKAYQGALQRVLDGWYISVTDDNDLLSKGLNGTSGYGDYAFLPRTDEVTYYNTLYVYALQQATAWATSLGDRTSAQRWRKRAATVSNAINAHLWDAAVGAYFDSSNLTTGVRHAQDGNSIAVVSGVANSSRAVSALEYLSSHTAQEYGNAFYDAAVPGVDNATQRVYAFISFFELQARFLSGLDSSTIEEIHRLYGWMTTHDPTVTVWEGIGPGGSLYEGSYTSMAHGWSTGVVSLLSNYVLGVRPTGPGFSSWMLEPHVSGLSWARGVVPTPLGDIAVSWDVEADNCFRLTVTVPLGSKAKIGVPASKNAEVRVDGRIVFKRGASCVGDEVSTHDARVFIEDVTSGEHAIIVE